jgi:hypothetical protein
LPPSRWASDGFYRKEDNLVVPNILHQDEGQIDFDQALLSGDWAEGMVINNAENELELIRKLLCRTNPQNMDSSFLGHSICG